MRKLGKMKQCIGWFVLMVGTSALDMFFFVTRGEKPREKRARRLAVAC
jgi:hypothetical protein